MKSAVAALVLAGSMLTALAAPTRGSAAMLTEQEAHDIGVDAYLYFYPLVSMDVTRRQSTNIELGKEFGKGPMNMFTERARVPTRRSQARRACEL